MKGRNTNKRIRKSKGFDYRRFFKTAAIRLAYRALELTTLFLVGYSLGLKLIKY